MNQFWKFITLAPIELYDLNSYKKHLFQFSSFDIKVGQASGCYPWSIASILGLVFRACLSMGLCHIYIYIYTCMCD